MKQLYVFGETELEQRYILLLYLHQGRLARHRLGVEHSWALEHRQLGPQRPGQRKEQPMNKIVMLH